MFSSLQQEVGSSVELKLRRLVTLLSRHGVYVLVIEIEIEGVDLLLEHGTKNVVSLE